jgi:predicted MFS family arabinose efflux permease
VGAVLGKMISMSAGLRMTMLVAAGLYLFSALVFRFTLRETREGR